MKEMLLSAHSESVPFKIPGLPPGSFWERLFDTAEDEPTRTRFRGGHRYALKARSVAVFRLAGR